MSKKKKAPPVPRQSPACEPAPSSGLRRAMARWLPVLFVFAAVACLAMKLLTDNNLPFHLNAGRWIAAHHAVPARDIATYTVPDHLYIDVHWLFQLFVYGVQRVAGFVGLAGLNVLLAILLFAVLLRRMDRRQLPRMVSCLVLLMAILVIHPRLFMRPESVSFIFMALVGLLLDDYTLRGRNRLFWIPLIQLAWVNVQGLFMLGWIMTAAAWLSACFSARRVDRPLSLTLAASVCVSLLNPYGWQGVVFPLQLLTRFDANNIFRNNIGEFAPMWRLGWGGEDMVFLALALLAAWGVFKAVRRERLAQALTLLPFFVLAMSAVRNVPVFVVAAMPMAAAAIPGRIRQWLASGPAVALFCLAIIGLCLRVGTGSYYLEYHKMTQLRAGAGMDAVAHPVAAAEFIRRHYPQGRILNDSNIGGWLSWALDRPVYMDQKLEVIGEAQFAEELASHQPGGLEKLLEKHRPDIIVFDYVSVPDWLAQVRALPEWHLVFVDAAACVWVNQNLGVQPLDLAALPAQYDVAGANDPEAVIKLLAQPVPPAGWRWVRGFWHPTARRHERARVGWFCESMGALDAAGCFYAAALRADFVGHADLLNDLGAVYMKAGRFDLARLCYTRFLEFFQTAKAYNDRGLASLGLEDVDAALVDFDRALQIGPASEMLFMNRAWARYCRQDKAGAISDYQQVLQINPRNERAAALLGQLQGRP